MRFFLNFPKTFSNVFHRVCSDITAVVFVHVHTKLSSASTVVELITRQRASCVHRMQFLRLTTLSLTICNNCKKVVVFNFHEIAELRATSFSRYLHLHEPGMKSFVQRKFIAGKDILMHL